MTPNSPPTAAAPSVRSIDYRQLPWAARLVCDYCHGFDPLGSFFVGAPTDPKAWRESIQTRQTRPNHNAEIATVALAQLQSRGAPPEALMAAERLADPATVAILTGQQAGLFGGPLFTLLKALTAVRLARQVGAEHDVTAIPVFWVHAEDHDLEEISSCGVLDADFDLQSVGLPHGAQTGQPASAVRLNDAIVDVVGALREVLPETEFSSELFTQLSAAYRPGAGLVEAFSRWMDTLLGPHGLVVFDASDARAKPLVQGVFDRELAAHGETSRLAEAAGAELSSLGYHAQVTPSRDAVALFHLDGTRQAIRFPSTDPDDESGRFEVGERSVSGEQLRSQVASHPDRFSPNVLLRPIVQDAMFPTVGYVAGPSELAYLAQLRRVYEHFEVPMPVIYPRISATIVDTATHKFFSRYDVAFEMLQAQDDGVLNGLLESLLPESVERTMTDAQHAVAERLSAVAAEVSAVDPTLVGAVDTTRSRMERDLKNLQGKIVQAAKRRDATLRRQFHRARSQAFPNGDPQERAVGVVYFLNRYGPHVVDRLMEELPLETGHHWLVTV